MIVHTGRDHPALDKAPAKLRIAHAQTGRVVLEQGGIDDCQEFAPKYVDDIESLGGDQHGAESTRPTISKETLAIGREPSALFDVGEINQRNDLEIKSVAEVTLQLA